MAAYLEHLSQCKDDHIVSLALFTCNAQPVLCLKGRQLPETPRRYRKRNRLAGGGHALSRQLAREQGGVGVPVPDLTQGRVEGGIRVLRMHCRSLSCGSHPHTSTNSLCCVHSPRLWLAKYKPSAVCKPAGFVLCGTGGQGNNTTLKQYQVHAAEISFPCQ